MEEKTTEYLCWCGHPESSHDNGHECSECDCKTYSPEVFDERD